MSENHSKTSEIHPKFVRFLSCPHGGRDEYFRDLLSCPYGGRGEHFQSFVSCLHGGRGKHFGGFLAVRTVVGANIL